MQTEKQFCAPLLRLCEVKREGASIELRKGSRQMPLQKISSWVGRRGKGTEEYRFEEEFFLLARYWPGYCVRPGPGGFYLDNSEYAGVPAVVGLRDKRRGQGCSER